MCDFHIREDDLSDPQTRALIALHLSGMHLNSPPEAVHALDLSGLTGPDITVWSVWQDWRIAAIGALKMLPEVGGHHAEIKSMRTHPDFLRLGVGRLLLRHILEEATTRGVAIVSLETGRGPAFEAAHALYRSFGFQPGEAFADYRSDGFSSFFHLQLT